MRNLQPGSLLGIREECKILAHIICAICKGLGQCTRNPRNTKDSIQQRGWAGAGGRQEKGEKMVVEMSKAQV